MAKPVDIDLRITAKNLSKKTLAELTGDVERLTEAQKAQAKSSDLAARSMKDLVAEQNYLAKASAELSRRSNLAVQFSKERAEIEKTSAKIKELAAVRKNAAVGDGPSMGSPESAKKLSSAITKAESDLARFTKANAKTGDALRGLGVDTDTLEQHIRELSDAATKSGSAYNGAVDDVTRYGQAVEKNNAILAEAAKRQKQLSGDQISVRQAAGRSNERAVQQGQLAELKRDAEARAAVARAADIQAEAQRRVATATAAETAQQVASEAAIRKSINAYVAAKNARVGLTQAFQATATAQEKEAALNARLAASQAASNERKAKLVALLKTERGQRLLNVGSMDQDTAATNRNAVATNRAAKEQAFFADTGRKSLSVYQRIRGQVLGLAAAYVGVYQVIGTFRNAIEATNRGQSLQIGLNTVNKGDLKAAASDYKFLKDTAQELGLVFDDIAPKFANLAIAGQAVGLSAQGIRDIFYDVSKSAAAMNLSVDDTEGVFRAMVQIFSKGKVQAEELRGQLGDRLPGAVVKFAAANKIALTDLDKQLKEGSIGIDFVIKGIKDYAASYDGEMANITDRLQAYINRAKNAYNAWLRALLNGGNQTALKKAFGAIEEFFKGQDGKNFAESLGKAFQIAVDAVIWLSQNIDLAAKVLRMFIAVQAAKFAIDLAGGLAETAAKFGLVTKWSSAANKQLALTAVALTRVQKAALGVAAVLLLVSEGFNDAAAAAANATEHTRDYIDAIYDATYAKTLDDVKGAFEKTTDEIDTATARVALFKRELEDMKGLAGAPSLLSRSGGDLKDAGIGVLTSGEEIRKRIVTEESRIANLRLTQNDLLEKQNKLLGEQLVLDEQARAEAAKTTTEVGDKPKKEKGPSAEDDARRQATAQRAIEREILDSQDNILQAQMRNGKVTDEMLEKNHEIQLKRNQIEYEDDLLKIEGLQQAAVKASQEAAARGRPVVDVSNQLATLGALAERQKTVNDAKAQEELTSGRIAIREQAINDLIDARDSKLKLINALQEAGQLTAGEAYRQTSLAQEEYNVKVTKMITDFQVFAENLRLTMPDLYVLLGIDKTLAGLQVLKAQATTLSNTELFKKKFGDQIASGFANAFNVFAQGVAGAIQGANSLGDAFKSAADAFLNFAADFLQQIAMMIIQQVILNALSGQSNGSFSGIMGQVFGAPTGHTGGVVKSGKIGHGNAVRAIPISAAANAGKFHEGGLPGLKSGEVVSILKKREEVVTADDPRNVLNGGMSGGGGDPNVTIVNSIDSASVVKQGWGGARNVILNDVKANQAQWRANLGIGK